MPKNINVNPYYDDFDASKNFHQVLFKPGMPVQARELTQLQSIIRDQIAKFGNHVFKHGSVVIPGNSFADLAVPFVKVQLQFDGSTIQASDFNNKTLVGATTGVRAYIRSYAAATGTDPNTFYLSYIKGSEDGDVRFQAGEELYTVENASLRCLVQDTDYYGIGSIAFVNAGVYYISGNFVSNEQQSVIISKYDNVPSCHVLFKITEEFVTSEDDSTLLDPAQGSYNFAAPGADRLKIALSLTTLPIDSTITDDYVELMRYRGGVLEEHAKNARYSELEKSLARRTYDESGNYIVAGLETKVREHKKESNNGGLKASGSRDNFVASISAGKAYIDGFEVEKLADTNLIVPKARTPEHVKYKEFGMRPQFGQYIIVSDFANNSPNFNTRQIANLRLGQGTTNAIVGTCRVIGIDIHAGDPSAAGGAIYRLYITDLSFTSGYSIDDVGVITGDAESNFSAFVLNEYNIQLTTGSFVVDQSITNTDSSRTATVEFITDSGNTIYARGNNATKKSPFAGDNLSGTIPTVSAIITKKTSLYTLGGTGMVFELPTSETKALKNTSNTFNIEYTTQKQLSIAAGSGSVSISDGVISELTNDSFVCISNAGVIPIAGNFSLNTPGTTITYTVPSNAKIYVNVKKTATPKTKTVTPGSATISSGYGNSSITLPNTDVVKITSITQGATDITDRFVLDPNQTDYAYLQSKIVRKFNKPAPTGTIVVTYDYYQHSAGGDFFSIDSYVNVTDYQEISTIFVSKTTGKEYELKNCIDFRPSVGTDGTFSHSSARRNDFLIPNLLFTSDIQYYVPRIDVTYIKKNGEVAIKQGVPSDIPRIPNVAIDEVALDSIYVPAYTRYISDVKTTRLAIKRSTMKDISDLTDRVANLEEFSTLTAVENNLLSVEVIDAETGLSRFKTGYLVEDFSEPFTIADAANSEFKATVYDNNMSPMKDVVVCNFGIDNTSTNYQLTNYCITLPYTERTLINQSTSSRVTNLNPFLMISWTGALDVYPSADHWVESLDLPTIFKERTQTVNTTRFVTSRSNSPVAPNGAIILNGGTVFR